MRKGTVLEFRRDAEGNLAARADDTPLITVTSRPLCAAIFDLYIGEQPVSKRAKQARLLSPWHLQEVSMCRGWCGMAG